MSGFRLKKIALTLGLSAVMSAHAAGLGTMTSSSKLGEPLNAEIELLAVTPGELGSIQAALASEQFYQDQMLEKPASYPYIKIEVANNAQGMPVLKLSSTQPINEAFLDMLIQVDWPTGRLVKEYTLLLDPPGFNSNYVSEPVSLPASPETAANVSQRATTSSPAEASAASSAPEIQAVTPAPVSVKPQQTVVAPPPVAEAAQGLEIKRGDTLHELARQTRPEQVSIEQMLAGLYQANPQAFDGKNMNRLKVGKILRIPDQSVLAGMSQQQAQQLVAAQTTDWLTYKNTLAKVAQQAPASEHASSQQQSAGKIASASDKPAPASQSKDVLKLSAGDEKSTSQTDPSSQKVLQDKLNALQEDIVARDSAIQEEKSRTAELEKQVADMKKLLAMKNDVMAQLQQDANQADAGPVSAVPPPVTTPQAATASSPAAAETAAVVPEEGVESGDVAPSFVQSLLNRLKQANPGLLLGLLLLPVLAIVWLVTRLRRKQKIDSFEEAIVTSPATEMQGNTVFGHSQAVSGDTSFLTDFSQSAVGGMIDANDVDPIAEAEVYMAYGRDAQAEEILKDAILKDPQRQELKVKLLEVYQNAENLGAFETVASQLYAEAGPADPVWVKVAGMGQGLDPNNPLYRNSPIAEVATSALAGEAPAPQQEAPSYDLNFETPTLEFQSSMPASAEPAPVQQTASTHTTSADASFIPAVTDDLTLASDDPQLTAVVDDEDVALSYAADETSVLPQDAALKPKALDLPTLDFDEAAAADADRAPHAAGAKTLSAADAAFDRLPDLSFELDETSIGRDVSDGLVLDEIDLPAEEIATAESEEVDTKLDLIRAYIDMEDMIGARELIDEVLREGGERQRTQAQALLAKLNP